MTHQPRPVLSLALALSLGPLALVGCNARTDRIDDMVGQAEGSGAPHQAGGAGGAGQSGAGGGGGEACGPRTFGDETCTACVAASCCSLLSACSDSQSCPALDTCLSACNGDQPCRQDCLKKHPEGSDLLSSLYACAKGVCNAECGMSCDDISTGLPGCDACLEEHCCKEVMICANFPDCGAIDECIGSSGCSDQACFDSCGQQFPAGVSRYNDRGECVQEHCLSECSR